MILHHYESSPYAEKVRLMFGLTNSHWRSLLTPIKPPRPSLDPLTGGYRRIPVAQLGADIFCDTSLIAREIAASTNSPALNVDTVSPATAELMEQAEQEVFFAAIGAVSPLRLLGTMMQLLGPIGTVQFIKDRASLLAGGTVRPAKGPKAKAILKSYLADLETRLTDQDWVDGDAATIADLATYHPLWLYVSCDRRPLSSSTKVEAWYQRVSNIGHGEREEITQEAAFTAAADAEPRPLPTSVTNSTIALDSEIEVAPSDYGIRPVTGTLAALTENRIIVARQHPELGNLHVHFPRAGYSLVASS
ncbi:MAG: glutathione S-transferase [Lysobacteraceae bacterium]|nr:MAG: glutathione S-transferase [Xanthomonadaceae bacterium]